MLKFDKNRDKMKNAQAHNLRGKHTGKNTCVKGRDKNVRTVSRFLLFAKQPRFSIIKGGDAYEILGC